MKGFVRGFCYWLADGLNMAAWSLREPKKRIPKVVTPKPLWYDQVNDKKGRTN